MFYVVFLDESSVYPSNFKTKQWQNKGVVNQIRSKLKYEKLTILGAMSRNRVEAVQFLCKFQYEDVRILHPRTH